MKKFLLLFTSLLFSLIILSCEKEEQIIETISPINLVDVFMGEDSTYNGVCIPTNKTTQMLLGNKGYSKSDSLVSGFLVTHHSQNDESIHAQLSITTSVKPIKSFKDLQDDVMIVDPSTVIAEPGFFEVYLPENKTLAALTTGQNVAFQKYTFPDTNVANIIIDPNKVTDGKVVTSQLFTTSPRELQGYNIIQKGSKKEKIYFVIKITKDYGSFRIADHRSITNKLKVTGRHTKGILTFQTNRNEAVEVKVGFSRKGLEEAKYNLRAESHNSFSLAVNNAQNQWEATFDKFYLEGGSKVNQSKFYTGIYQSHHLSPIKNDNLFIENPLIGLISKNKSKTLKTGFVNFNSLDEVSYSNDSINNEIYSLQSIGLTPLEGEKYKITAPVFDRVSIDLFNGKNFVIEKKNRSKTPNEVSYNGNILEDNIISEEQILLGGILKVSL
ncbi:glycoside hydrolase domain-containing protein [Flammeovirga pacifica]|uniref:Uncharacterized protein n=1 Tax=Flammeovirga pacifica TaxID=915059 RepID=A0A1S1YSW1_FLAPC|nr:glycoside hydrolase domain-containing protein [Flammeovirga pacifica]OHX64110.1 hypothetical protein NH26_21120 [Flammeovirga pacifica]